jgi:hypothetical protein
LVPAEGASREWTIPGAFLGAAEAAYPTHTAVLGPGERLIIGTDGIRADDGLERAGNERLTAAAARHRGLTGQAFVEAMALDLLVNVRHEDDFTLLVIERVRS